MVFCSFVEELGTATSDYVRSRSNRLAIQVIFWWNGDDDQLVKAKPHNVG